MAYIVSENKLSGKCIQLISQSVDVMKQPAVSQSATEPACTSVCSCPYIYIYIYIYNIYIYIYNLKIHKID